MKQYAIQPLSLLSSSDQGNMMTAPKYISLAFISNLSKGKLPTRKVKMRFFQYQLDWMSYLNKIIEEAWKHKDNPELLLKKFQEVFEDYQEDSVYLFEYANALDFLGEEDEAIPLYQRAIELGISGKMKTQAEIQLGSSLSVTGKNEGAIGILSRVLEETEDPAALIFLCIALFRAGETKKSLKAALNFILSGGKGLLPEYKRSLSQYLEEID
ncbi:MAG: tetratricopeptide repeat protein [Thermoplasmataceae archaeon]